MESEIPFADMLEASIRELTDLKCRAVCVLGINDDGEIMTSYGGCTLQDKVLMAGTINGDVAVGLIMANAKAVVDAANEEEEDAK